LGRGLGATVDASGLGENEEMVDGAINLRGIMCAVGVNDDITDGSVVTGRGLELKEAVWIGDSESNCKLRIY